MQKYPKTDYAAIDRPEVLSLLFHPRKEYESDTPFGSAKDILIPVGDHVEIGGRFHTAHLEGPNILFFHG